MWIGIALALTTSLSWAVGNVVIQRCGKALGAPRAMLWALTLGGVLSALCSPLFDQRLAPFSATVLLWILAAGISGLMAYVCLFYALANAPLSVAVPLVSSWSLVSAVLSLTLLGESLRASQCVGAACTFLGVLLVSVSNTPGAPSQTAKVKPVALLAAVGSGVGFGVMVPAIGQMSAFAGEFGASALAYAAGIVLAVPLAILLRVDLRPPPRPLWGLVLLTGAVETLGFVAVAMARRFAPMALVAPVASLAATFTVLYAAIVLGERPPRMASWGAALVSVGIVILAL